jgi:D-3-phosphoglycerate dehydrogenase / 2-oxoglutarate reductase
VTLFKVVVSDQVFPTVDLERRLLEKIDARLEVADGTRQSLIDLAHDADAVLNTYLPIDRELISQLPRCKVVARYGIGVDNIDLQAAAEAGLIVTNVPDYSVEEVAVHTTALILALLRHLPQADAIVRGGGWGLAGLRPIRRVSELTIGLVGFGRIGRRVAHLASAIGASLVVHDPYIDAAADLPGLVSLDELLARSDVISLHLPLTDETRGLFDANRIRAMRRGSILVNTSRGGLLVLDAVLDALRAGYLGGAGLDVFEVEPVVAERLAGVPNLLVTPHMAYYSEESIAESQRKAATQVVKVLTGTPPDYAVNSQWMRSPNA